MSLGRTVNCWETFEKENKGKEINSVAIIGYNYSGKSTFCELSMSFIGGKRNK